MTEPALRYERFLGRWALDPDSCAFEQGAPPQKSMIDISQSAGEVVIRMALTDAEGQVHDTTFRGAPNGVPAPFDGGILADALSIDTPADDRLDSAAFWKGEQLMTAMRTLSADGNRMEIVQTVRLPDETVLTNTSSYIRTA